MWDKRIVFHHLEGFTILRVVAERFSNENKTVHYFKRNENNRQLTFLSLLPFLLQFRPVAPNCALYWYPYDSYRPKTWIDTWNPPMPFSMYNKVILSLTETDNVLIQHTGICPFKSPQKLLATWKVIFLGYTPKGMKEIRNRKTDWADCSLSSFLEATKWRWKLSESTQKVSSSGW